MSKKQATVGDFFDLHCTYMYLLVRVTDLHVQRHYSLYIHYFICQYTHC